MGTVEPAGSLRPKISKACPGEAGLGEAGPGLAWHSKDPFMGTVEPESSHEPKTFKAGQGRAWPGEAGLGEAWPGMATQGPFHGHG